ncbi:MAG: AI-2E family transporter [Alphaproteobacteria bacterium]
MDSKREDPAVIELSSGVVARYSTIGIFVLAAFYTLYFAAEFLIPVVSAFVLNMVFAPIPRGLRRMGIPYSLSAGLVVISLVAILLGAFYGLSTQVTAWIDRTPEILRELPDRIQALRQPIDDVVKVGEDIQGAAEAGAGQKMPQEVVIKKGSPTAELIASVRSVGFQFILALFLLFFLLASGDMFTEKAIKVMPRLRDKRRALLISRHVTQEVSNYLFTITIINTALGVVIGLVMSVLGMPNPLLIGVMAALLNFVPYFGAIIGALIVGAVGLVTFDSLGQALVVPVLYVLLNSIEGYLVTPSVLSRRLTLSAPVIFLAIGLWGFLWGITGALLAVPILIITKVVCDQVGALNNFGEFLSGKRPREPDSVENFGAA